MIGSVPERRIEAFWFELGKIPAFFRRDLLVAWSYRLSFFLDWAGLIAQSLVFAAVQGIVDPSTMPSYGGTQATYLEFVTIGIALSSFMAVALGRVYAVVRQEQVQGTLESLLLTPTAFTTIQLGSVAYDLLYVPVRTGLFLIFTSAVLGTAFHWSGVVPMLGVVAVFIPFVWGIGILAAAWTITFKRGTGVIGLLFSAISIGSGTYFPLTVLPEPLQRIAAYSPLTIALDASREALIGGAGWAAIAPAIAVLIPSAAVSMALGIAAFRIGLARERRRGSLGLY